MKKKIIGIVIAMTYLVTLFPAVLLAAPASEALGYTVTREIAGDQLYHHFALKGSLPAAAGREAKLVAVPVGTVEYNDATIKALDQTAVAADGSYLFDITLAEAGDYLVEISFNGLEEKASLEISIKDKGFYDAIVANFNNASASPQQMAGYITEYAPDLMLYTYFFDMMSQEEKNALGQRMKNHAGSYRIDNINRIFSEECIYTFLQYHTDANQVMELITFYNSDLLKLDSQAGAKNIYASFDSLPLVARNAALSRLRGVNYTSFEAVQSRFNESVILGAFFNMPNGQVHPVLKANNDYLKLSNYDNLSDEIQINEILNEMRKNGSAITSIDTFRAEYAKAYETVMNGTGGSTTTPGGGGGTGSGGGRPSGPNTSIDMGNPVTPDKPEQITPGQGGFSDLESVPWAQEAINSLFEMGILNGKTQGVFAPNDNITREEFAKIIVATFQLLDENAKCDFTDMSESDWSYAYVASAKKYEMVKGYDDGRFGKNDPITRQDMAVMIYRALVNLKLVEDFDSVTTENLFVDQEQISAYALNSVIMLKNMALLSGDDQNRFLPADSATRAEVAVVINRVLAYKQ